MELKKINLNLKQKIQQNNAETLMLSPWEIAGFLEVCNQALNGYILNANEQLGEESEAYIAKLEIEKIDSVFRELSDNFFPMAHSNEPLRRLQIVDKDEYLRVSEGLLRLSRIGEEASELSGCLSQSIRRMINP